MATTERDSALDDSADYYDYERQLINPLLEKEREAALALLGLAVAGRVGVGRVHGLGSYVFDAGFSHGGCPPWETVSRNPALGT
jgi:hypothetical protein